MKHLFTAVMSVAFIFGLVCGPQTVSAATKSSDIESLLTRIEALRTAIAQRADFEQSGPVAKTADDPDYFTFQITNEQMALYGKQATVLNIQTDGSVNQILISTDCTDIDGLLFLNERECSNAYWLSSFKEKDGLRTFSLPLRLATDMERTKIPVSFHACRFNGCQFEDKLNIPYKNKITFADQVKVYDRYEWTYEWNNNTYHVQEVLLSFPAKEIRKVKLNVKCDARGLYIRTDEELRATCNSKRDYSQVDFGDEEIDEQGNIFNLRIESVTDNISEEQVGAVKMMFSFVNWQNRVIHELVHVPLQLEEPLE